MQLHHVVILHTLRVNNYRRIPQLRSLSHKLHALLARVHKCSCLAYSYTCYMCPTHLSIIPSPHPQRRKWSGSYTLSVFWGTQGATAHHVIVMTTYRFGIATLMRSSGFYISVVAAYHNYDTHMYRPVNYEWDSLWCGLICKIQRIKYYLYGISLIFYFLWSFVDLCEISLISTL